MILIGILQKIETAWTQHYVGGQRRPTHATIPKSGQRGQT